MYIKSIIKYVMFVLVFGASFTLKVAFSVNKWKLCHIADSFSLFFCLSDFLLMFICLSVCLRMYLYFVCLT